MNLIDINGKIVWSGTKTEFNNSNIETGGFRTIDLERTIFAKYFENFNLVEKMDYSSEYSGRRLKRVLLFKNLKFQQ